MQKLQHTFFSLHQHKRGGKQLLSSSSSFKLITKQLGILPSQCWSINLSSLYCDKNNSLLSNLGSERNYSTLSSPPVKGKTIKITNDKQQEEEITTSQLLAHISNGNVLQFAKSSEYSQAFNKLLRHASSEEFETVFQQLVQQSNIVDLCTDSNGSIVMERIISRSLPHQLEIIFNGLFSTTTIDSSTNNNNNSKNYSSNSSNSREDAIQLLTNEYSSKLIYKMIPKLTGVQVKKLLVLLDFNNSEVISILVGNENSTSILVQLLDVHLNTLERFTKEPMILFLLNLDDDQIDENRLKQLIAKSIEKCTSPLKLKLTSSLVENITQLNERHSYALSRSYTRIPTNSKEFEEASSQIVKNFYELAMNRDHKDIINAFIGFSNRMNIDSLIHSLSVEQIEELLKDKNGLIAFSNLFSKATHKKNILKMLSPGKIVELSKNHTSSFFFSSLAEGNRECALVIIEMVKSKLVEIATNKNSSFLAIKLAEYPEGRKALLTAFRANIVEYYTSCQSVIFHIINKSSSAERTEILQYCILSKLNLDELLNSSSSSSSGSAAAGGNGAGGAADIPEPLFKLILLFIKKGSLNDHTKLLNAFQGRLIKLSTGRNSSILLQELYQISPQVIRDAMNHEILGNIQQQQEEEELDDDGIDNTMKSSILQSMTANKHSKHLLNAMLNSDPSLKTLLSQHLPQQVLRKLLFNNNFNKKY